MKVAELIEILEKYNPELEVISRYVGHFNEDHEIMTVIQGKTDFQDEHEAVIIY